MNTADKLDRYELQKRLEAKKSELEARIAEAEAGAASNARSQVEKWKGFLSEIETTLESGVDEIEKQASGALRSLLDRIDSNTDSTGDDAPKGTP